jgi:glutamine synthetase
MVIMSAKRLMLLKIYASGLLTYDEKVKSYFQPIRYHVDKLEQLIDDALMATA